MIKKEIKLGYMLNKASHLIKWQLNNSLKKYDLTSAQWAVISDLFYHESIQKKLESNTPALIAERLKVERPAITRIIERLLKEGWILKLENPTDKRSQLITLTDKALSIIPEMKEVSGEVSTVTFDGFTEEEIIQLESYLTKIIGNLNK